MHTITLCEYNVHVAITEMITLKLTYVLMSMVIMKLYQYV